MLQTNFNIEQFLTDYNIPYHTSSNDWIVCNCPILGCKDRDYKMGYNQNSQVFNCFRCGKHSKIETIQSFLNISYHEASFILKKYSTKKKLFENFDTEDRPDTIELPKGCKPLNKQAIKYLEKRGYDPYYLQDKYGLLCMDEFGEHPHRILVPIYFQHHMVSWTARSYSPFTDKAQRYYSCSLKKEVIPHKSILYNWDNCKYDTAVIVEGPFDVLKGEDGFVCSFGTQYCNSQINLLKEKKKVFVLFDSEPKAQEKSRQLVTSLSMFGVNAENVLLETAKDVGDLSLSEVKELRKELELD